MDVLAEKFLGGSAPDFLVTPQSGKLLSASLFRGEAWLLFVSRRSEDWRTAQDEKKGKQAPELRKLS